MTAKDQKQRVEQMLKKMEEDTREAVAAVASFAKLLDTAPVSAGIDHAYLVRHANAIGAAAERVCKALASWKKHY